MDAGFLVEERHGRHRCLRPADIRVVEPGLTGEGAAWLAEVGITVPGGSRRPLVRACLDWTERRSHMGGAVGAALCGHALIVGWVTRIGTTRALTVSELGR